MVDSLRKNPPYVTTLPLTPTLSRKGRGGNIVCSPLRGEGGNVVFSPERGEAENNEFSAM